MDYGTIGLQEGTYVTCGSELLEYQSVGKVRC